MRTDHKMKTSFCQKKKKAIFVRILSINHVQTDISRQVGLRTLYIKNVYRVLNMESFKNKYGKVRG